MNGNDGVTIAFELILGEIEAIVSDVNSEGAACIRNSQYDAAKQKIEAGQKLAEFRTKLDALRQEWVEGWSEPIGRQVNIEVGKIARTIASGSKSSKSILVVKFSDGTVIFENKASDTFAKAIAKFGIQSVMSLGLKVNNFPLVSKQRSEDYSQTQIGDWLIMTHSSTDAKRSLLLKIADGLKTKISVEVVPGQNS